MRRGDSIYLIGYQFSLVRLNISFYCINRHPGGAAWLTEEANSLSIMGWSNKGARYQSNSQSDSSGPLQLSISIDLCYPNF